MKVPPRHPNSSRRGKPKASPSSTLSINGSATWSEKGPNLPKSAFGKALSYTLEQWENLQVFLTDGRLEIDNNLVENAIRPTAIGKKNWLFMWRDDTGWRSAVIYSVLGSCRARGIEPYAYLKTVLEPLPVATNWQVKDLTSAAWANGNHLKVVNQAA